MEIDRHESAKWTQATGQATAEYLEARDKILAEEAARGFPLVTGEALSQLLALGLKIKKALTVENGKIYEEERTRINELIDFNLKLAVQYAKLAMEFYRETLFNEITVEQTEEEVVREIQRADVERLEAEVEQRQGGIIIARASAQAEVNTARLSLAQAEQANLPLELSLVNAQLATAETKLQIIDSIYEVIAAENLVIAAEGRRIIALQETLVALLQLAAIKQTMIPLYQEKAAAELVLADAITKDAQNQTALINLGFQRTALKLAEAQAESTIHGAELTYELAKDAEVRASDAVELARIAAQTAVQTARNAAQASAIATREDAEILQVDTRWSSEYTRMQNQVNARIAEIDARIALIGSEISNLVADINSVAISHRDVIHASMTENIDRTNLTTSQETIIKGS
jgi:hypothetical protein